VTDSFYLSFVILSNTTGMAHLNNARKCYVLFCAFAKLVRWTKHFRRSSWSLNSRCRFTFL